MKHVMIKMIMIFLAFPLICATTARSSEENPGDGQKIRMVFQGGEATVALFDNPLAKEFFRRLPLEVKFEDFSRTEKIFYMPEKLDVSGGVNADQRKGDFCYYAPWGNIAVFYKGYGHGRSLYVLGMLESGKDSLARLKNDFKARIEAINSDQSR